MACSLYNLLQAEGAIIPQHSLFYCNVRIIVGQKYFIDVSYQGTWIDREEKKTNIYTK